MFLQLIIDGKLVDAWQLDETVEFRHRHDLSGKQNYELRERVIQEYVLNIKQDYYNEIACSDEWAIVLQVKSKVHRFVKSLNSGN